MKILPNPRDQIWQTLLGALALIVAIGLPAAGWYFTRRELSYQVVSQTPLVSVAPEAGDDIEVFFQGQPVTNVYVSTIVLSNSGGQVVTAEDFDRDTPIEFALGPTAEILSASVFNTIPNGLMVSLRQEGKSILIDPVLLNPGGEIRFKVVTIGESLPVTVKSSISGINEIKQMDAGGGPVQVAAIIATTSLLGYLSGRGSSLIRDKIRQRSSPSVSASNTNVIPFKEHFDGPNINTEVWLVDENSGRVEVKDGSLYLSANGSSVAFPYVRTRNDIIPDTGDFAIKVGIQYLSASPHGTGVTFANKIPDNFSPEIPGSKNIWQDDVGFEPGKRQKKLIDKEFRNIEFRWRGTHYEYFVDGAEVERGPITADMARPTGIWMGNHVKTSSPNSWSSFRIDYIEVVKL